MGHILLPALWRALIVFIGMLLSLEIGQRIASHRAAKEPEGARAGVSPIAGIVFALLGLLIAFTFAGAAGRFDARRNMDVEEANRIEDGYIRIDLLPADAQPALRESFRSYVDARLALYQGLKNLDASASQQKRDDSAKLLGGIWQLAVNASYAPGALPAAPMILLPAVDAMFDIANIQNAATQLHPPPVIFAMLMVMALASALLAGLASPRSKTRDLYQPLIFALLVAFMVYIIIDMEYPRIGLIRIDDFDQTLMILRQGMK